MYVSDVVRIAEHARVVGPASALAVAVAASAVTKRYGGISALKGVDLAIGEGEIFGIIGPNGAGKSTLFDVLCGIVQPTSGEVQLFGRSIGGMQPHEVARLGVARSFQRTAVFAQASVSQNLFFAWHRMSGHSVIGRLLHSRQWHRDQEACRGRARHILEITGLWEDRNRSASVLAYGVQRRLAVGVALMTDPSILFLDEPAAGMDDHDSADFVDLIRRVAPGRTVVLVEHDMTVIRALCHRCLAMVDGRPLVSGKPLDVLRHPEVVEAYLGAEDA
jgi:branched-chain amino acid transport system ATP-binding protein